jgi:hypothetical protein
VPVRISHRLRGSGRSARQTASICALTDLAKATAAANAAVPGVTMIRVETDSGDATYEAHMTRP